MAPDSVPSTRVGSSLYENLVFHGGSNRMPKRNSLTGGMYESSRLALEVALHIRM